VVAEKFQTGFDQPLLHTMLVDRKLAGVHAVQTLSRLNRTHPGKDDTFVLDFVNTSDDILAAYAPFYETTLAGETDPNLLFDARDELNRFGVLRDEEVEAFARVYFDRSLPDAEVHSRIHAQLDPAKHRFADLDDDDQETFRRVLHRFVSLYAFVSQILPLDDTMLEKRYQYCRLLEHALPRPHPGALDLGDLELTHLRLRRTGRHTLDIATGEALPLVAFPGVEPGPTAIPGLEPLSEVIRRINELFGLDLGEADRLHIESVTAEMVDDTDVQQVASANTLENFAVSFDRRMVRAFVDRMDKDEKLTIKLLDDPEFKAAVKAYMLPLVYERARVARQKSCPIGDLLGPGKEDQYLEYKAGLRWDIERGEKSKVVESAVIKTVAAFLNSAHGGTLLIGVRDDGAVAGLEGDYATLRKQGREDRDLFQLHLTQIVANAVGMAAAANVTAEILAVDGDDVCRLHVEPSAHPVRAEVTKVDRKGQFSTREAFFVRMNNATKEIPDPGELQRYIAQRWGGSAPSR
ncbi:MAG: RNA-binding domain-containing protein, partial [Actinomycetota bacterium]